MSAKSLGLPDAFWFVERSSLPMTKNSTSSNRIFVALDSYLLLSAPKNLLAIASVVEEAMAPTAATIGE